MTNVFKSGHMGYMGVFGISLQEKLATKPEGLKLKNCGVSAGVWHCRIVTENYKLSILEGTGKAAVEG
jgi:hypothetical protein